MVRFHGRTTRRKAQKARLERCPFPKHEGEEWTEVVENDPEYVEWLISGEGPDMDSTLLDHLTDLLEGDF